MSRPGHNGGPGLDGGQSWRRHCWRAAREALLPKLPVEVIRTRVRRAGELGLDYRTYAGVRAQSGHDVIALLFSTNALRLLRDGDRMAAGDAARLAATCGVARLLAAQPPLDPERVSALLAGQGVEIAAALRAPGIASGWGETGRLLRGFLAAERQPAEGVVVIGATELEHDWVVAARLAAFIPARRYFGAAVAG